MQIHRSVPFFRQIHQSANIFDQIGKVNVNATVTSNFAQIVKKVTCLMTITQNNSNNSLTPELFRKKKKNWMNSLTYRPRLKKDLWSNFRLWTKIKHQNRHNPESVPKVTADPRSTMFSNPWICLIYGNNPQSTRFLRPNPSIRKHIHPPPYSCLSVACWLKWTLWLSNQIVPKNYSTLQVTTGIE